MNRKERNENLSQLCAILARLTQADLLIVDRQLKKICSTYDEDSAESRSKITAYSIITNVVTTGKPVVLNRAQDNPGCNACLERGTCRVSGFIGVPIRRGTLVLGALAFMAPIARCINVFGTLQNAIDMLERLAQIAGAVLEQEDGGGNIQIPWECLDNVAAAVVDERGRILTHYGAMEELFPGKMEDISSILPLAMPLKQTSIQKFTYAAWEPEGFFGDVLWAPGHAQQNTLLLLRSCKQPHTLSQKSLIDEYRELPFRNLPPYRDLIDRAEALSCSQLPILLLGKNGSGKGILAAYLHAQSTRSESRFVPIDCQSLPPLRQTEAVFGIDEDQMERGLLWQAVFGTVFFKNIEYMSAELQDKICEMLSHQLPRRTAAFRGGYNIRCLFASDLSLEELYASGFLTERFLNLVRTYVLEMPELKTDQETFFPVFSSILAACAQKHRCTTPALSEELKKAVCQRERTKLRDLYQIAELIVRSAQMHMVTLRDVPSLGRTGAREIVRPEAAQNKEILRLMREGISKKEIASRLCISRATLYRRLRAMEKT